MISQQQRDKQVNTRCICDFRTSKRRQLYSTEKINVSSSKKQGRPVITNIRMELDLHADMVVFGRNSVVIQFSGREYDVAPYTDAYDAIKSVRIETSGTAYTSKETGKTYILVFHEGLWMGDLMEHSLQPQPAIILRDEYTRKSVLIFAPVHNVRGQ